MGIDIEWIDENNKMIQLINDEKNELVNILNKTELSNSLLIKYIDLYGDTIFNQLQIPNLLKDFEDIIKFHKENRKLNDIVNLIKKSMGEIHTYIKFIGD